MAVRTTLCVWTWLSKSAHFKTMVAGDRSLITALRSTTAAEVLKAVFGTLTMVLSSSGGLPPLVMAHPIMVLVVLVAGTLSAHNLPEIHQCPAGTLSLTIVLTVLATTTVAGRVADKILAVLPLAVLALTPSAGVVAMMAAATLPAPITAAARV